MDSVLAGGVESIIIIIYLPVKTVLYLAIRTELKVGPMSIQEPHLFLRRSLFSGVNRQPRLILHGLSSSPGNRRFSRLTPSRGGQYLTTRTGVRGWLTAAGCDHSRALPGFTYVVLLYFNQLLGKKSL